MTGPSQAQEILSWWHRGLLPLDLSPGSWVEYESTELAEGRSITDTLRVTVLDSLPGGDRWVELDVSSSPERHLLLVDRSRLGAKAGLLEALIRYVRLSPSGELVEESSEHWKKDRLIQRHFQDPFDDPRIERSALADTLLHGQRVVREVVVLSETRQEESPMGANVLVLRTDLRSRAVISETVPIFGLMRAHTSTVLTSRMERAGKPGRFGRRRGAQPLINELWLRCLGFGRDSSLRLPETLRR